MSAQQTFRNTLVVILTVMTAYVLLLSVRIVVILLVAIIVASAVRPFVLWFEKRGKLPYTLSILLVYALLLLAIFGLFIIILPPAASRLGVYVENDDRLASKIIEADRWVERNLEIIMQTPPDQNINLLNPDDIRTTVHKLVTTLNEQIPALAGDVGGLFGDAILVFVIGVYWLTSRDAAIAFTLQLFPLSRRTLVRTIMIEIEQSLGAYMRGVALVVLFVGTANFILLTIFRVPNATTLSFIIGITTALPIIGGYIGAGIAVFIALLETPLSAVLTLASFVLVQQIENHYLTPRVMSNSVHISPILVIIALFIGFSVGGVIGALIAVPIAGTLMVLARYLVIEPLKDDATAQRVDGGVLIGEQRNSPDTGLATDAKPTS